jgi:hypothetical protein
MKPSCGKIRLFVAARPQVLGYRASWIGRNRITKLQNGSCRQIHCQHIREAIDVRVDYFIGGEHGWLEWQIVAACVRTIGMAQNISIKGND